MVKYSQRFSSIEEKKKEKYDLLLFLFNPGSLWVRDDSSRKSILSDVFLIEVSSSVHFLYPFVIIIYSHN